MNWQNAEHVLAGLGVLSMLLHALEAGCNRAGFTKYEGIFQKFGSFIEGFMGGIKPPTKGQSGATVAIIVALMTSNAFADSIPVATTPAQPNISITEVLNAMGAQAGYFYGVRAGHGYSYVASKFVNVTKNISIDGGLIATSGAALTINYDLIGGLSLKTFPVLGFFDTFKAGVGGMITDVTAFSDGSQINKIDNRLDFGGDVLFSKRF